MKKVLRELVKIWKQMSEEEKQEVMNEIIQDELI